MLSSKIKKDLFSLADPKYKEFHGGLCPGTDNIIGVRVPILRNYAKKLAKEYDIEKLITQIDNEYYEEIMLQGMLIGLEKEEFETTKKQIANFIPKIDNWAICDVFCAGLKITKRHKKEMWKFLQKYLNSDEEFEIRFGVVMLLDYYIEEEYLKKDFEILGRIKSDDYYAKMAVSWAISVALVKFFDETVKFLENTELSDFIYNKSIQKAIESYRITKKQKDYLRKMKR